MKYLTAAVKDAVLATGISIHDTNRHTAAVRKATNSLRALADAAAERGLDEEVWAGFFKLSANEPHRLPKLVDSIVMCRLPEVGRALVEYNRTH